MGLAIVCLLAVAPASTLGAFPGANGRIAYQFEEVGVSTTIHTVLPNGSDDRELTIGVHPSWSPNGRRIAFVRSVEGQSQIFTMRADGTDQRQLTHNRFCNDDPAYSPNGGQIVFARADCGPSGLAAIVAMRAGDGTNQRVLAGPQRRASEPEFSPTGEQIVFRAFNPQPGIWVMQSNGWNKQQLTRNSSDVSPDYRPDAGRIIISRLTNQKTWIALTMAPDGSDLHPTCGSANAAYSPNGHRIASAYVNWEWYPDYATDIWIDRVGCGGSVQVTHFGVEPGIYISDPSWQPLPDG